MRTDALSIPFWSPAEIEASIPGTVAHLAARRVLAYPTETVYGFGGATDQESVDALIQLKTRAPAKPFLILVASSEMLGRLDLRLAGYAAQLAARHWPGPLTLVLPGGERRVPEQLRGPEGGIAVRWTSHPALQRMLQAYGEPITSTSANRPGTPPAMSAHEVEEQKRAVYDAGYDSWTLWNPGSLYEAFVPALEKTTVSRKKPFGNKEASR